MVEEALKLNPSKLGTKEYWDEFYSLEEHNFEENPEDTGECWFSDSDAETKMIDFLMENLNQYSISETSSILDVGTGNGHLLFQLREEGFKGELTGIDYSSKSVEFASKIARENEAEGLVFEIVDIFDKKSEWNNSSKQFDIVLDKGTLDAIALSEIQVSGRTAVELYSETVQSYIIPHGVFLITSCNFTEEELIKIIESHDLKLWKKVDYPSFEFGGKKGQTISTLAFIKT